ncbi:MAG: LPS assembly lipoprotein LptE [Alcanivorax sp.]|nr:LPS assembly lipoprotein LptE [Alcanivorax sp.]
MIKRLFSAVVWVLLLLPLLAQAATETVSVQASGYGDDPQQAVTNALVAAVRQAGGVSVALDPAFRTGVLKWVVQQKGDVSTWAGSKTTVPEAQLPTLGNLQSYKVKSVKKVDDNLWRAELSARVLRNKALGPDRAKLPAIAVTTFASRQRQYSLGEASVPARQVQQQLRDDLVTAFAQSGRFRVLDRSNLAAIDQEQQVMKDGSVAPAELARLGQRKGADLLLVGTIEDFSIGDHEQSSYGAKLGGYQPRVRVRYRLVDTASSEILWADLFDWDQSEAAIRELARQVNVNDRQHPERLADLVYPQIARAIAGASTDVLYPVQVLKVAGDNIYLRQGQGRLEPNALMDVYRPAGTLKDPDTGLPVKLDGLSLATVRVTAVHPGYGIARLVDGGGIKTGDRVRGQAGGHSNGPLGTPAQPAGQAPSPGSSEAPIQW